MAAEDQEGDEAEELEQTKQEWLAAGPQAPELDLDQHPRRQASRGPVAPAPAPVTKKVKNIASKGDRPDVTGRYSSHLSGAKTPPAKW